MHDEPHEPDDELQDVRDDEEREVDYDDATDPITGDPPSWRDRYDREEEWHGDR